MVLNELQFIGAVGMPRTRYYEIFSMIEHGSLDPAAVVSETVSLDQTPQMLASMTNFDTVGIPVINEF